MGLLELHNRLVHGSRMDVPLRLIAQVFAKEPPSLQDRASLRARLAAVCAENGSDLTDLIFEAEKASRPLADYAALVRIARGEADGLVLTRLPLSLKPRKSRDRLCTLLEGPIRFVSAQELRERGLLPILPREGLSLEDAAQRALDLRAAGHSLRQIAEILHAEGYRTARDRDWHAGTVEALLTRNEPAPL